MSMDAPFDWTHPAYEKIAEFMEGRTGMVFSSHRRADVESEARKAMARMNIQDVRNYLRRLETEKPVLDDLTAQLSVGETYFFREPAQFQLIREKLIPEILERRGQEGVLRAWSAGCSSGEEAYSLGILLDEEGLGHRIRIQATDISKPALLKARKALYSAWSLRDMEPDWIARYFLSEGSGWRLRTPYRRRVEFSYLNLSLDPPSDFPSGGLDLILCRNVMIYFGGQTIEAVFRKLIGSLAEGGWLVSGPSDPVYDDCYLCEKIVTPSGVVYQKNSRIPRPAPGVPWKPDPSSFLESFAAEEADSSFQEMPQPVLIPSLVPSFSAESPLSQAQRAFARMDYGQVLELTRPHLRDAAACLLSIRAAANLQGSFEAEQAAGRAVGFHPLSAELHYLRAVLLMDLGRDPEAVQAFRKTLYLDRTLAVAHFTLGAVLRRLQDWEGARRAYENTLELCKELPPETIPLLSDGESAGQLREAAQTQLSLLGA